MRGWSSRHSPSALSELEQFRDGKEAPRSCQVGAGQRLELGPVSEAPLWAGRRAVKGQKPCPWAQCFEVHVKRSQGVNQTVLV